MKTHTALVGALATLAVVLAGCQAPEVSSEPITLASRAHLNYCTDVMRELDRFEGALVRLEGGSGEEDWEEALAAARTIGDFRVTALAEADEIEAFEGVWLYRLGLAGTVLAHYGDLDVATEDDFESVEKFLWIFVSHIPAAKRTCIQVTS